MVRQHPGAVYRQRAARAKRALGRVELVGKFED